MRGVALCETQVKKLLAHREPFLFIRHVIKNDIGKSITAVALQDTRLNIPEQLHLLEGLGQASALLIRQVCLSYHC